MENEKKFDSEREELSKEELETMEIFDKVHKHELTAFQGFKELVKLVEKVEVEASEKPA